MRNTTTKNTTAKKETQGAPGANINETFQSMQELVCSSLDHLDETYKKTIGDHGISTGFSGLDKITGGLQDYELVLVAGRAGMGKTSLVLNIAGWMALRCKKTVMLFSLESPRQQLVLRMIFAEGLVDSQKINNRNMSNKEWENFVEAADRLSQSPLIIDDTANISATTLCNKAREIKKTHGLDCIIIDSLQLMNGGDDGKSIWRRQQITNIAHELKALARELKVPIIVVSHLDSKIDNRPSKRPVLSDLQEEAAIEQAADLVAFLYREDYYYLDTDRPNITELIIAKQRNGPVGAIELYFHKAFTRFTDYIPRRE